MMDSYSRTFRIAALAGVLLAGVDAAHGAGITGFYVRKGVNYEQNSASAPSANDSGKFIARATGPSSEGTLLSTPSDIFQSVPLSDQVGDGYEFSFPGTPAENEQLMPPGNYVFTFPDSTLAPLNFSAGAFPTAVPQISNYAATQAVAPASALNLTFNAFTGASANDVWEFQVVDSNGDTVLNKSGSTGTTVTIPANTLTDGENYDAYLRFVHNVASNSSSVPGVTGTAGYYNETHFQLVTTGSGGGGGGNPTLVSVTPTNGATDVARNTPVMFIFDKAMAPQQSIIWTGVDASKFTYAWSFGQLLTATYTGGFPANTTVTYNLQAGATGFKDASGNPLVTPAQGSFTTGSSGGGSTGGGTGVDPCLTDPSHETPGSSGSVFKSLQFVQTSNSAPVPDPQNPAAAFATYIPTNQTVNTVTVTGPNNINITLDKIPAPTATIFSVFQDFPSAAAVDTAFPPGNYTITASPAGSGVVAVPAITAMPIPSIVNLTELKSFDPTKDFLLKFSPFTGASGQFDSISIQINDSGSDRHFYAPDFCVPRTLPNTATSVTIPANTFHAGDKLTGSISFSHFAVNATAIPNTTLSAGSTVTTSFDFTGGSTGSEVHWNQPTFNANGTITFTATAPTGTTVIIEKSTDLKAWTTATTSTSANGTITYTFDPKTGGPHTYFRGKVQ